MSPSISSGLRRVLTNLDAAALADIGWAINLPAPVPGDYNGNGTVDAADYTVWRDTLGWTANLQANGNNSGGSAGVINQADYTAWKINFGQPTGGGSGAGADNVPEPSGALMLVFAVVSAGLAGLDCAHRYSRGAQVR